MPKGTQFRARSWEWPGHLPVVASTQATSTGCPGCTLPQATLREVPREGQHSPSGWFNGVYERRGFNQLL